MVLNSSASSIVTYRAGHVQRFHIRSHLSHNNDAGEGSPVRHGNKPSRRGSPAVLLLADLFHPVDILAVDSLLDGSVRHARGGRRAVPVFHARRDPHDITWPDLLLRAAPLLHPPEPGGDNQDLTHGMGVPARASAGLERDVPA